MKRTHRLNRNYLKGILGDQINALMAGIGHNLKMILRKIFWLLFLLRNYRQDHVILFEILLLGKIRKFRFLNC